MGLFDSFFKKKNSADEARDRLKLLLVSDRSNCSPETMEPVSYTHLFRLHCDHRSRHGKSKSHGQLSGI